MGIIYKIQNNINNKCYIGQTIRTLDKRWKEHCNKLSECFALNNAIKKYSPENFTIINIQSASDDLLDDLEKKYIIEYNSLSPNGYNLESGGKSNKVMSQESRNKMREKKLGINNPNYGKPRKEVTKLKISIVKTGEKHHFYGKELTNEHKLKLSQSHKTEDLPMFLIHLKERPETYQAEGYAIVNNPKGRNKYFTSKKLSLDEKFKLANQYLLQLNTL